MKKEKNLKINVILNIVKTCTSIIFPLITFPYISRVLLPENVGKVNFGSSFVSYFSLIASLGIATYAIRECSKVRDDKKVLEQVSSQIFSINVCTTIIAYVLLALVLICFKGLDDYRELIVVQSMTIVFATVGADWLNSAMEDFVYITIRTVAFQVVSLVLMFLFVKTPDDYIKYAAITVISSSGANIVNVFYRRRFCRTHFVTKLELKKHFKPILFLFAMILSQTIFNSADVTMLGLMKGDYEVGIYSTAAKMERLISQIVSSIVFVLIPRLSYMFAVGDFVKINHLLRKVLGVILLIGVPAFAGATVMAEEIILIIAGEEYIEAIIVLQIMLISFLFSLVGGSFLGNIVLLPSGKERLFMCICCVSTVVNLILNAMLIPAFGARAAAATTAVSSFVTFLLLLLTKDRRIQIEHKRGLVLSPVVGSIIVVAYCLLIKWLVKGLLLKTVLCGLGGVIIYGIVIILMKNEVVFDSLQKVVAKIKGKNSHDKE